MITIEAPAKLNLTLEILGKRSDGYHEIKSVAQTINLCDTLSFTDEDNLVYTSNSPDWHAEKSLVSGAVALVMRKTGYDGGAAIHVEKRIPLMAGLGGDSSDAAAVLQGLNRLWKLRFTKRELAEMAAELGSDVPFFIYGGTCLMEGRGEKITSLPAILHRWIVLVVPGIARTPDKTKNAYAQIQRNHYSNGKITDRMVTDIRTRQEFDDTRLFNTFENIFFSSGNGLSSQRNHILHTGVSHCHLAGSGPGLFTLFNDRKQAEELFIFLGKKGMDVFLTETRPESLD
jgi:4-diphosphocytidyl-2-C-methyl-D-erythritol kinase